VFAKYEDDLAKAQHANKARRVQTIPAKIADTFGLISVGNVSGRWLEATNGKSAADASTGMSRNMLRYEAIARGATFVDTSEIPKHSDLLRLRKHRWPQKGMQVLK
jgi:hypothetical protein